MESCGKICSVAILMETEWYNDNIASNTENCKDLNIKYWDLNMKYWNLNEEMNNCKRDSHFRVKGVS